MLLGSAAFAGMGLGTAALIRSADGASAVVNLILLPMAFISGSFVPTQEYPEWLQTIGDVLPLKHLIDLLRGVYLDGDSIVDAPGSVAVLAAWGCSERWWRALRLGAARALANRPARVCTRDGDPGRLRRRAQGLEAGDSRQLRRADGTRGDPGGARPAGAPAGCEPEHLTIVAERRQEYAQGTETVVNLVAVNVEAEPEDVPRLLAHCEEWAADCAADRHLETLDF